jgi:hypothetical protein
MLLFAGKLARCLQKLEENLDTSERVPMKLVKK